MPRDFWFDEKFIYRVDVPKRSIGASAGEAYIGHGDKGGEIQCR